MPLKLDNSTQTTDAKLRLSVLLLLIAAPFGVALQNMIATIATLLIALCLIKNSKQPKLVKVNFKENEIFLNSRLCIALSLLLVAHLAVSVGGMFNTALNQSIPLYLADHALFFIIPVCFSLALGADALKDLLKSQLLPKVFFAVVAALCLVVISQGIWGWNLVNNIPAFDSHRPSGFYSNALTLAYVLIFLFPVVCVNFLKSPLSRYWGTLFLLVSAAVVVTNSRMILALCFCVFIYNIFNMTKGKARVVATLTVLIISPAFFLTSNHISKRFQTLNNQLQQAATTQGQLPPRFVFWRAHLEMLSEKPFFGHGPDLTSAYRAPYYEKSGGAYLDRPSTAHNQYLQVAANGGLVALVCFLGFLSLCKLAATKDLLDRHERIIAVQALVCFMLGGLTQNAFQDSEVRYVLMLLIAWLLAKTSVEAEADTETEHEAIPA